MKNPIATALIVVVGVLVLIAYSSFYIVDPRQQAIVRQFGEIKVSQHPNLADELFRFKPDDKDKDPEE